MAKYYGAVGYSVTKEKLTEDGRGTGIWAEELEEHFYRGEIIRNTRKWESTESINDNLNINNSISIIADDYAYKHLFAIKYVSWMGTNWKVTNAEVQRPRLILTIGGVFNETQTGLTGPIY